MARNFPAPPPVEHDLLYEVVNGDMVEKEPMGAYEVLLGSFLNTRLDSFARAGNYGKAVSEMLFDFGPDLPQRRPDVASVSYQQWLRQRRVPRMQAWAVIPELAVEVVSPSHTFDEVLGKTHEYFRAAVLQVWMVAPPQQQIYVCRSHSHIRVFNVQNELTGDPILPGFPPAVGRIARRRGNRGLKAKTSMRIICRLERPRTACCLPAARLL